MNKFILILFLGASMMAIGQVSPSYHVTKKPVSLGAGLTLTTTDINKPVNGKPLLNEKSSSAKLYLKLDLGEDYVNTDGEFEYEADFIITATGTSFSNSYTLNISQTDPEQILEIDLLNEMNLGATEIVISSASVSLDNASTPLVTNYKTNNISLTATFVREYAVDVRLTNNTMAPGVYLLNPATTTGRLVTFVWEVNSSENFPNYEVQILRLYNTDQTKATNNSEVTAEVDWNKALRVETQSPAKEITLNIAEGTGFYIWRVRPIGNFYPGGIANQENYGVWNTSSIAQGTTEVLTLTDIPSRNDVFYVNDPDENINWIYNRVFTEGNQDPTNSKAKVSEGISYADGLLRARQTQAYNSSNSTTLVTQTVSDYSGRPAFTTLPVPVGDGLTGYKLGFVQNGHGGVYTAIDYDKDSNIVGNTYVPNLDNIKNPEPVKDDAVTSFNYYNGTNANGVADAEGYPFKRTIFKTDGTGRVDEESGVGKMHALGTQGGTLGGGRTTRILFGTPSDEELIRIFGDEAPLAESVIKTLTIDPNNVVSTTYTSKEGKTIATALIDTDLNNDPVEDDNLLPLDLKNLSTFIVNNTANQNIVSNNKMISSRRIALEVAKDVTLSYTSALPSMGACAGGDCKLKARFFLNDLKNGATYVSNANISTPGELFPQYFSVGSSLDFTAYPNWVWEKLDPSSPAPPAILTRTATGSSFNLASGEYIITKEVFSTNGPNFVEDQMTTQSEKYAPVLNALADKIASIVNAAQYAAFQSTWLPNLNTLISTYQGTPNTSNSDAILTHLGLVRDQGSLPYDVASDYLVPVDISFTNLTQDPGDPSQQNTFTMTIGPGQENGGCCPPMPIAVPKPEICPACEGKEEGNGGNNDLSVIISTINANILAGVPLEFGIEDIRTNTSSVLNNGSVESWGSIYGTAEWNTINNIVGYEFMDYLYQKLALEGFIDLFFDPATNTINPNGYDITKHIVYNPVNDPDLQVQLNRFAPGFTYTSLQYMITNMLVSRYYTGKSLNGYRAKENETTGLLEYINNEGVVTAVPSVLVTGIDDGNDFNYECKQLFECWIQAVDLLNAFEFDDDLNVMDSFNDEQGGGEAEEHANDDDSKEEDDGSWLMDQILEMVISVKMRDFQDSDEGTVPKERLEAMVSLPKVFMECAGYYYADILDETTTLPADYSVNFIPSGIDPLIIMDFTGGWGVSSSFGTQTPILVSRDGEGDLYDSEDNELLLPDYVIAIDCGGEVPCAKSPQLYYPYTLKPEWMFKYFVYNAYQNNGNQHDVQSLFAPVLNQFQLEYNSCYQDMFVEICASSIADAYSLGLITDSDPTHQIKCSGEECRYTHENWSAGQRLNFYKQLNGGKKCPIECSEDILEGETIIPIPPCLKENLVLVNGLLVPNGDGDGLVPSANHRLDDMIAVCDYRRNEFKSNLISELVNGCWVIVKCSTETYHITEAQINLMVDKVVAECKAQVNGVRAKLNTWYYDGTGDYTGDGIVDVNDVKVGGYGSDFTFEYPTCIDQTCFYLDLATRTCPISTKRTVTFFPECDQLTLDQVSKWNFEPSIGVANLNGDNLYGLNPDGTPKDAADVSQCAKYSQKEWRPGCSSTSCSTQGCNHVDGNGNTVTNTYSSKHNIPEFPAP